MVARPRPNITLYIYCLSFCILFSTFVLVKDKLNINLSSNHNVNGTMCDVYAIYTYKLRNYVRLFNARVVSGPMTVTVGLYCQI